MNKNLSGAFQANVLGFGLGVGGIAAFAKKTIDTVGGLGELSEQLGVSTDALQVYQYGAIQAGVSQSELEAGLSRLTKTIGEAADGNKSAVDTFNSLGVGVLDANGKVRSTENVFRDVATAISKIEDPATRARVAVELMGRGGQRLLPLLSGGAKGLDDLARSAHEAGAVLDADLIKRFDEVSDSLARFGMQATVTTAGFLDKLGAAWKRTVDQILGEIARLEDAPKSKSLIPSPLEVLGFLGDAILAPAREVEKLWLKNLQDQENARIAALPDATIMPPGQKPEIPPPPGTHNPPPKKTGPDPLDQFFNSMQKRRAALEAEAQTAGQGVFETEKLKVVMQAEAIAKENNIKITDALRQKIDELATAYAFAAAQVKEGIVAEEQMKELNAQIDGLERLTAAYAESSQAGLDMEARLEAEAEKRKNAAVDVDKLTEALIRRRKEQDKIRAEQTIGSIRQNSADLRDEADALARSTIEWNQYTGAFEVNDREARILAEAHRLLAQNTEISAAAAMEAATAHVDAADKIKRVGDELGNNQQVMNASTDAVKGFFSDLVHGAREGEDAMQLLSDAVGRLGDRLLDIALDQIFNATFKSSGGFLASLFGGAASSAAGSAASSGIVDSLAASGAFTLHSGGIVGQDGKSQMKARRGTTMRSDEVIGLLQKGEEVITVDDPRHRRNLSKYHTGGIAGRIPDINIPRAAQIGRMSMAQIPAPQVNSSTKVVNTFDATSFLSEAVTKKDGETVLMNFVSANRQRIRATLGV